jgi:hypothetical protein
MEFPDQDAFCSFARVFQWHSAVSHVEILQMESICFAIGSTPVRINSTQKSIALSSQDQLLQTSPIRPTHPQKLSDTKESL